MATIRQSSTTYFIVLYAVSESRAYDVNNTIFNTSGRSITD